MQLNPIKYILVSQAPSLAFQEVQHTCAFPANSCLGRVMTILDQMAPSFQDSCSNPRAVYVTLGLTSALDASKIGWVVGGRLSSLFAPLPSTGVGFPCLFLDLISNHSPWNAMGKCLNYKDSHLLPRLLLRKASLFPFGKYRSLLTLLEGPGPLSFIGLISASSGSRVLF